MKKLNVHIENNSSTSITVKGRNGIKIPAHATGDTAVTISLPDTPQVAKTLGRLRREYPALRVKVNKEDEQENTEDSGAGDTEGQEQTGATSATSGQLSSDESAPLDKEAFAARVTGTTEKGSGWWNVTVEGFTEPFKVRGAKDEASAVELAYEAYLEDFTSPAKGE